MEHIFYNQYNLKKEDIKEEVVRVKALIINSNNEVLVGYSNHVYMFIGGHLEKNEPFLECLSREIKEETGIDLELKGIKPFLKTEMYCKNSLDEKDYRNAIIYYYVVKTDEKFNKDNTNYTKEEEKENFKVRKILLDDLEDKIIINYNKYPHAKGIGLEMINALRVYKSLYLK